MRMKQKGSAMYIIIIQLELDNLTMVRWFRYYKTPKAHYYCC